MTGGSAFELLKVIEQAGRVCYKSEDKITMDSHEKFIKSIISRGHEAVIEHGVITCKIICDRGVSHEIVRHRLASYCQESTRYCNYSKEKFGGSVTMITPPWLEEEFSLEFEEDLRMMEQIYFKWLKKGWTAQQARGFLPTFVKTELVMTGTVSHWKHFFDLRCPASAHPQARELAQPLHDAFVVKGLI